VFEILTIHAFAGRGIEHAEMFPLVNSEEENPVELFQIWINLPRSDKLVDPYFTMFWQTTMPRKRIEDRNGRATEVVVVAGSFQGAKGPAPPPNSWASKDENEVRWSFTKWLI
jgi:quercetin 2,3-dioxygenase